jgi:hypothetical protein
MGGNIDTLGSSFPLKDNLKVKEQVGLVDVGFRVGPQLGEQRLVDAFEFINRTIKGKAALLFSDA